MAKQQVTIEVDVPDEYGELEKTGEVRRAKDGEFGIRQKDGVFSVGRGPTIIETIIFRRVEPDAVKLARAVKAHVSKLQKFDNQSCDVDWLADKIIADFEKGGGK